MTRQNAWNARNAGMPECWHAGPAGPAGMLWNNDAPKKKICQVFCHVLFTQQHFVPNPITKKLIVNTFLCIVLVDQYFLSWLLLQHLPKRNLSFDLLVTLTRKIVARSAFTSSEYRRTYISINTILELWTKHM